MHQLNKAKLEELILCQGMVLFFAAVILLAYSSLAFAETKKEWTTREVQKLLAGLEHGDWDVREQHGRALQSLFSAGAKDALSVDERQLVGDMEDYHLPTVVEMLAAALRDTKSPDLKWRLQEVEDAFGSYIVQRLESLQSRNGGAGFYDGMFESIAIFGKHSLRILRVLAYEDEHSHAIRNYAAAALGSLGENSDILALSRIANDGQEYNYVRITAASSAFALGDRSAMDLLIAEYQERLTEMPTNYFLLSRLAECYVRVRDWTHAESSYAKLLLAHPRDPIAHYNMACMHSCRGNNLQALAQLRTSIKNGYRDLRWMQHDRSLEPLRTLDDYQRIVRILEQRLRTEAGD